MFLSAAAVFAQDDYKSLYELRAELQLNSGLQLQPEIFLDQPGEKKTGLAILYSLLLPGMGELYAGDYSFGQYLTIADGILWGVLFGFDIYGTRMESNYKNFAETKGGANIEGKNEKYYADLGNYLDIEQYNRRQELDRNFAGVYDDSYYWKWDSQEERREYRRMWKSSENAYNNIRFAAGALILNRIVSAINAVRLTVKHNRNLEQQTSWNISFGVNKEPLLPTQMIMNIQTSF